MPLILWLQFLIHKVVFINLFHKMLGKYIATKINQTDKIEV